MRRGESILVQLICVGSCLMPACSGCAYSRPRHGVILRGDWSLELNRVPWVGSRAIDRQERSELAGGCDLGCSPQSDCGPAVPNEAPAEDAGLEPAESQIPWPPEPSDTSATFMPGGFSFPCRSCTGRRHPLWAKIAAGRVTPPRFHPVPLKPVFAPRTGQQAVFDRGIVPIDGHIPVMPSEEEVPATKMNPAAPRQEEIPPPYGGSNDEDRATGAPGRFEVASRSRSWIFSAGSGASSQR